MPAVTLNGSAHTVSPEATVLDLVATTTGRPLGPDGRPMDGGRLGVAVAVNAVVIPRSRWNRSPVVEGQSIEIITTFQGG